MPYKGRRKGGPGSAGGRALVAKYGRDHMARIGLLGAQALLDNHGTEHMAEIGRNGYYTSMQRYSVERPQPPIPWDLRHVEPCPHPPKRKHRYNCSTIWIRLLNPKIRQRVVLLCCPTRIFSLELHRPHPAR